MQSDAVTDAAAAIARRARRLVDVASLGLAQRAALVEGLTSIPEPLWSADDRALIAELVDELTLVADLVTERPTPASQVAA